METLLVKKLNPAARLPERAKSDDLGYDIFAVAGVTIAPGGMATVKTGIAVAYPSGWGAVLKDRSSMAIKRITISAGVIDHGYRGEILALLSNHGETPYVIEPGQKIAQMIPVPVTAWHLVETAELCDTDRGADGFGSTGT